MVADVAHAFEALQTGDVAPFCNWVRAGMPLQSHLFDRASVDADLEWLGELIAGEVD